MASRPKTSWWFTKPILTTDGAKLSTVDEALRFLEALPRDRVTALAFCPSGQLFSGTLDATVLAWDPRVAKLPSVERK